MTRFITNKISYFLFFALFLTSCATKKSSLDDGLVALPKVKKEVLIQKLNEASNHFPTHFYTKMNSKFQSQENTVSFKTSVKMSVDSALQATITYANIPMYNAIITPDSLTLVDKRENCFIQENVGFLKKKFNVDFQYKNIEEIILGKPVAWNTEGDYRLLKDPYNYVLSSTRKDILEDKELNFLYYMDKEGEHLEKVFIESSKDSTQILIQYGARQEVEGFFIPESTDITINSPKGKTVVSLKYGKISINEPRVLYLAIPSKYEQCE